MGGVIFVADHTGVLHAYEVEDPDLDQTLEDRVTGR